MIPQYKGSYIPIREDAGGIGAIGQFLTGIGNLSSESQDRKKKNDIVAFEEDLKMRQQYDNEQRNALLNRESNLNINRLSNLEEDKFNTTNWIQRGDPLELEPINQATFEIKQKALGAKADADYKKEMLAVQRKPSFSPSVSEGGTQGVYEYINGKKTFINTPITPTKNAYEMLKDQERVKSTASMLKDRFNLSDEEAINLSNAHGGDLVKAAEYKTGIKNKFKDAFGNTVREGELVNTEYGGKYTFNREGVAVKPKDWKPTSFNEIMKDDDVKELVEQGNETFGYDDNEASIIAKAMTRLGYDKNGIINAFDNSRAMKTGFLKSLYELGSDIPEFSDVDINKMNLMSDKEHGVNLVLMSKLIQDGYIKIDPNSVDTETGAFKTYVNKNKAKDISSAISKYRKSKSDSMSVWKFLGYDK